MKHLIAEGRDVLFMWSASILQKRQTGTIPQGRQQYWCKWVSTNKNLIIPSSGPSFAKLSAVFSKYCSWAHQSLNTLITTVGTNTVGYLHTVNSSGILYKQYCERPLGFQCIAFPYWTFVLLQTLDMTIPIHCPHVYDKNKDAIPWVKQTKVSSLHFALMQYNAQTMRLFCIQSRSIASSCLSGKKNVWIYLFF